MLELHGFLLDIILSQPSKYLQCLLRTSVTLEGESKYDKKKNNGQNSQRTDIKFELKDFCYTTQVFRKSDHGGP